MTFTPPPIPPAPTVHSFPGDFVTADDFDAFSIAYRQRDDALLKRIAELAPADPKIRWGVNATSKAQHDAQLPIYSPVDVWRYYQNPGEPIGFPKEYALGPGETFVYSQKNKAPTVAQWLSMMSQGPPDQPLYACPWHEYEDDIEKGNLTQAQVNALFHTCRLAQQQVGPRVKIVCCLMGWTWQPASKRNVELLLPADADYDILTSDTYFAGSIGGSVSTIPTAFDAQIATAAKHGKTWGVTETGVGQKVSGQTRNDAIKLLAQTIREKLLSQPVIVEDELLALYFSVPGTSTQGQWALSLTDGSAAAWHAGQAA